MITANPPDSARLTARLVRLALRLARARAAARRLPPGAAWRRAELVWPLFAAPPQEG